MAFDLKKNWWIIAIVALLLLAPDMFKSKNKEGEVMAAAGIESAIVTRDIPDNIQSGQAFTVTYTASGFGEGNWGVLVEDAISGGCSPTMIYTGGLSQITTYTATVSAPLSGTCTFLGTYVFAGSTEKTISGDNSITVYNCDSLKISALGSVSVWLNNPTSATKSSALNAILLWAVNC